MESIHVLRAIDPYMNEQHVFSIVASDSGVEYVFPSEIRMFDGEARIKELVKHSGSAPKKAADWAKLASFNMSSFMFLHVGNEDDFESVKDAVEKEKEELNSALRSPNSSPATSAEQRIEIALSNLRDDDPEFAEYLDDLGYPLPEDKKKLFYATLISAAGTTDLNPWLVPWLNGENDLESMGPIRLILRRPEFSIPNYSLNDIPTGEED